MEKLKKKTITIIQARLGSTRYPEKVLEKIDKLTIIETIIKRLKKSKFSNKIIVATTTSKKDDKLCKLLKKKKINIFRGSENNVLKRYYDTAKKNSADYVVRICADSPFVDPFLLDEMIKKIKSANLDYVSNTLMPTYPDGLDMEVFTFKMLRQARFNSRNDYEKEHVTPYIIKNSKKKFNFRLNKDLSKIRLTLDEKIDLNVLINVYNTINKKLNFGIEDIINLIEKNKRIFLQNRHIKRNIGAYMNKGQKLWQLAKNIIPGGNMLLSKRPDMFSPESWPPYFSKAKGCYIWDLNKKKFLDLATMSVGTNILGYSNNSINNSVINSIKEGNMSSLNCPEEVYLSQQLLKMHKDFDMVKYAKTGGEANAIAIRIARAFTKKENIAICGYHGWHDWYLSVNLKSKNALSQHLLPGLSVKGVPKSLKNTVYPFEYNNLKKFYQICKNKNIGIVKMEVFRNYPPKNNFLRKIRNFCTKNNIILIFDECTSGFRETFGGLYLKYHVVPDLCILGKALGNGYPITAIMGRKKIMQSAQETFISSTFWTERSGYVAALKTLEEMEKIKSWKKISNIGKYIKKKWKELAKKNKINIEVFGLNALPGFKIKSPQWLRYKSYITYIMIKNSILTSNVIYVSVCHSKKILKKYFKILDKIFQKIKRFENGENNDELFKASLCNETFKRLN